MRLAKDKVELKRCPFCGSKVGVTDGVMGKIRMYCCMNFKGCGATILIDEAVKDGIIIARSHIDYAPTIIEADKAESEENNG